MFVASGDIHFKDKTPRYRKDEFSITQFLKFKQLLKYTAQKTKYAVLLLAGDIFDSKGVSYATVVKAMELIRAYPIEILLVPGQHDLRYHRQGLAGTPLGVLLQLDNVHLLQPDKVNKIVTNFKFMGAGWEEEPIGTQGDVLVTHRMVTKTSGLWPGHTDFTTGKKLLQKYPQFKYIISGDNHKPHIIEHNGRININTGSMMRTNKDQYSYRPAFWHITKKGVQKIAFKIKNSVDVFDTVKISQDEKVKKNNEKFKDLTDQVGDYTQKPNFERILKSVIVDVKPSKAAITDIQQRMERLNT